MREPAEHAGIEAHAVEQRSAAAPDAGCRKVVARPLVGLQDVAEVTPDTAHRVQRVHAALQDEGEAAPPPPAQFLAVQAGDVDAVEGDHAALEAGRRAQHPGDGVTERGLPGAGLAHEPDELALLKREVHVANRPDPLAAARLVDHVDATALQQGHHFSLSRGLDSASTPKLISVNDTMSKTIARPGARTIAH